MKEVLPGSFGIVSAKKVPDVEGPAKPELLPVGVRLCDAPPMDERRDAPLIEAVVLAALGLRTELAESLRRSLADGVDADRLREALLQVLPYAGFPRAASALLVLAGQIAGDSPRPAPSRSSAEVLEAGSAVFRAVYGEAAEPILANMARAHPDLPDWILSDAYGKVLARPGLDLPTREVLGVALLTALDQPDQLQGHVRGGLRVGADPARLRSALETAARHVSPEAGERARERLRREI
jgi:4-carboxymuconolactone decarboxylase